MVHGRALREGTTTDSYPVTDGMLRGAFVAGDIRDERLDESAGLIGWEGTLTNVLIKQQHASGTISPALGESSRLLSQQREYQGFDGVGSRIGGTTVCPTVR